VAVKTILVILLLCLLMAGVVNATGGNKDVTGNWHLEGQIYPASVQVNPDGTGIVKIGWILPFEVSYTWVSGVSENQYIVTGWGRTVTAVYDPVKEEIISPGHEEYVLVRGR
jgi:hypothetical protein